MSKQPNLFSFFSKSPSQNKNKAESSNKLQLKGKNVNLLDLVWAKLEGFPWWPALVCENPSDKSYMRKNQIHVQFFDNPPTRGWVKDTFVKGYESPEKAGIPRYKDPEWLHGVKECNGAVDLTTTDRACLLVEMLPSDEEPMEETDDDSDKSKENIDINIGKSSKKPKDNKSGQPADSKRRKIYLDSDSDPDNEDVYKPAVSSDDDSLSSGVEEDKVTDIESLSEPDSPVKKEVNNKRKRLPVTPLNRSTSSSNKPSTFTPKVSDTTKSKLALFTADDQANNSSSANSETDSVGYPHHLIELLKPDKIRDRAGHRPDHPEYNPRTLYVSDDFLSKQTPGMRQWWVLKSHHYDTVLFFKMGKFYELFHMDAEIGLQELGLLMMKGGSNAHSGFPEIAYGRYSSSLIEKGYKIARIEQTETPEMMEKRVKQLSRPTKFDKVVRREVCQVTSKGTRVFSVLDGDSASSSSSYLLSITEKVISGTGDKRLLGVAFIDTSIGTFHLGQFEDDRHTSRLHTLLAHYPPSQILYERNHLSTKTHQLIKASVSPNLLESLTPEKEFWTSGKTLTFLAEGPYFKDKSDTIQWPKSLKKMIDEADSLGVSAVSDCDLGVSALGGLLWYLTDCKLEEQLLTQHHFETYTPIDVSTTSPTKKEKSQSTFFATRRHMVLDGSTLHNLEVFENSSGGTEGTLMHHLDSCSTTFGRRLLYNWLCNPLCNPKGINSRLDAIEDLRDNIDIVEEIIPLLKKLPDLERLLPRIHTQGMRTSKDHPDNRAIFFEDKKYSCRKVADFLSTLNGFKSARDIIKKFKDVKDSLKSSLLKQCVTVIEDGGKFPNLKKTLNFFDNAFDHTEAQKEGKIIPCAGVDQEYDEAMDTINITNNKLNDYLKEQSKLFGAKVVYWGTDKKRFQLEVPEHNSKRAGKEHELSSQKKGHRRYITKTTKALLAEMMEAEEQRDISLKDIARRIFNQFDEHRENWSSAVQCLSVLDVLLSFAHYARVTDSVRPSVVLPDESTQPFVEIQDGRHPCTVRTFSGDDFIPNDVVIGGASSEAHAPLVIVTGPNMGGKSTLMRQTALICLLAQLGCYVPASSCKFTPIDRIFTRLGAWDRIMMGESTFYVELAEASSIIQHATSHSLVLVDELGRGTATYDGTAIASAVVDALTNIGCRTLFSTHYHSLVDDFNNTEKVSLGHMACMVEGENEDDPTQETITFLYKFAKGACPKSYGFNAARLADIPDVVIRNGSKKAIELEKLNINKKNFTKLFSKCTKDNSENLREILKAMQTV